MLVFYFLVITTPLVLLYRAKVQLFSDIRKYFRRKAKDYKQKAGFFIKDRILWRNSPHRDANVENYATTMFHKSSTFAAKNKRMKKHPITPIQQVVCKNVKALLVERKISVRELSININKDHSQLNKILNNQAILPAYLIDDFATFFEVDRRHLITDKKNILDTDDTQNLIIIRMQIPAYNMYNQIKKWIRTFVH
jgi:hypothetical protein